MLVVAGRGGVESTFVVEGGRGLLAIASDNVVDAVVLLSSFVELVVARVVASVAREVIAISTNAVVCGFGSLVVSNCCGVVSGSLATSVGSGVVSGSSGSGVVSRSFGAWVDGDDC